MSQNESESINLSLWKLLAAILQKLVLQETGQAKIVIDAVYKGYVNCSVVVQYFVMAYVWHVYMLLPLVILNVANVHLRVITHCTTNFLYKPDCIHFEPNALLHIPAFNTISNIDILHEALYWP